MAKAAPCTLRFFVATEGAANAGFATACLLTAGLMLPGLPLTVGILLSLAGPVASFLILRRYYANQAALA